MISLYVPFQTLAHRPIFFDFFRSLAVSKNSVLVTFLFLFYFSSCNTIAVIRQRLSNVARSSLLGLGYCRYFTDVFMMSLGLDSHVLSPICSILVHSGYSLYDNQRSPILGT